MNPKSYLKITVYNIDYFDKKRFKMTKKKTKSRQNFNQCRKVEAAQESKLRKVSKE